MPDLLVIMSFKAELDSCKSYMCLLGLDNWIYKESAVVKELVDLK